jgi:hypothetical protein
MTIINPYDFLSIASFILSFKLIFDINPHIVKFLDKPRVKESIFEKGEGLGIRWIVTSLTFSVLFLLWFLGIFGKFPPPHPLPVFLRDIEPVMQPYSLAIIIGFALACSPLIGLYIYRLEPFIGGTLYRINVRLYRRAYLYPDEKELDEFKKSIIRDMFGKTRLREIPHFWVYFTLPGIFIFCIALFLALILYFLQTAGELLLIVGVVWVAQQIVRKRIVVRAEWRFLKELPKKISAPKKVFFDVASLKFGLVGLIKYLYVLLGLFMSVLIISIFSEILGSNLLLPLPAGAYLILESVFVPLWGSFILVGVYSLISWYSLLRRLPVWLSIKSGRKPDVERAQSLPPYVDLLYPLLFVPIFMLIFFISIGESSAKFIGQSLLAIYTSSTTLTGFETQLAYLIMMIWLFFLALAFLLYYTVKKLRCEKSIATTTVKDKYRIIGYMQLLLFAFYIPQLQSKLIAWEIIRLGAFSVATILVYFVPEIIYLSGKFTPLRRSLVLAIWVFSVFALLASLSGSFISYESFLFLIILITLMVCYAHYQSYKEETIK